MKILSILKQDLLELCTTIGVHGLHNVSNENKTIFIRALWILVFMVMSLLCGTCIKESVKSKSNLKFEVYFQ